MRKLKVGYWPLSSTLDAAGDRRRLVFWAKARGHSIILDLTQRLDVIVASENSDFNSPYLSQNRAPIIFDLVDGYLSPTNFRDDIMRGLAKHISGQISGDIKPFSHHVRDFCLNSSAVICSSVEQQEIIEKYSSNTHAILDSHDEIPLLSPERLKSEPLGTFRILWEGQPATMPSLKVISPSLTHLSNMNELKLEVVTDRHYYVFLNKYLKRNTRTYFKRELKELIDIVNVTQWSQENLVDRAKESSIGVLPLDLSTPMQRLKPENRLLLMWRLGLPCLTSPSPSYTRVSIASGVDLVCENQDQWSAKIEKLMKDPKYSIQEVKRGQQYLSKMHTREILLDKWDCAIESVL